MSKPANKISVVRVLAGLFGAYFFVFYFQLLEQIFHFRNKTETNFLNLLINQLSLEHSLWVLKILLVILIFVSVAFTFGKRVRACAVLMWAGYTFFYNFVICINQPHITYYIYILMIFAFFPSAELNYQSKSKTVFSISPLWILVALYMAQMSISGFSKALSPEWRTGEVLQIMSQIRDPEPGVLLLGTLPNLFLRVLTWAVLILECGSIFYLFLPKARLLIWISHILMYVGILFLVPHATHVAFVMIVFNLLIFDPRLLPARWRKNEA